MLCHAERSEVSIHCAVVRFFTFCYSLRSSKTSLTFTLNAVLGPLFDEAGISITYLKSPKLIDIEATNSVNVRKGPSKEYGSLGTIKKGDKLPYWEKTFDNGWYLV